jgi:hypothetical protein
MTFTYQGNQVKIYLQMNYAYNKNGAMTKDLNKGISEIKYGISNLPLTVDIKSPEARNEYACATSSWGKLYLALGK